MEITKIGLLLAARDYYDFKLGQHSTSYTHSDSKPGHEVYFNDYRQCLTLMDELITEQEEAE